MRAARVARSCLQWITECCHYVDTKPKDAVHRLVEWFTIQVNRNACPGPLSVTTPVTAPPPPPRRGLRLAGAPPPCAARPPLPLHAPARHRPLPPASSAPAGRWPAGAPAGGVGEKCDDGQGRWFVDPAAAANSCPPTHLDIDVVLALALQGVARLSHQAQEQAAGGRGGMAGEDRWAQDEGGGARAAPLHGG